MSQEGLKTCRDLNCSQLCEGNGTCACFAGYELQKDGVNCQEIELHTVQRCCRDGRDRALAGQHCTSTPPISSPNICNITKEQCCSAAVRDGLCDKGVKMAEWQEACETPFFQGEPWEIQISKTCCDCCMLGRMTASRSSSCNFQGLLLLESCLHTARGCCEKSTTAETKPIENEIELRAVQTCCQDGRDRAYLGQHCTTLYFFSSSYSCSTTREQCCSAAVGEWFCKNGTELAKEKGTCHGLFPKGEHWETQMSKMCCDCCLLGLMKASQNSSCDFQGFLPGSQCLDSAKACCEKNTTVIKPTTNALVTESPRGGLDTCKDLNCSQLCEGNGTCACFAGYELQKDGVSCQDLNECVARTSTCLPGQTCVNTVGSYTCLKKTISCGQGYHPNPEGTSCEDVDECRTGDVCGGNICVNLVGTYRCECRIGFMFNTITTRCEDIDECAWHNGGHQCSYSCSNVPGSFHCTCPSTGYTLASNERTCQDIDECALGTHTCSLHGSCFNILGGFRCLSMACPQYFQLAAHGKDTSASWNCFKVCRPQYVGCYDYPINLISYISISLPTLRVISEPKEITFLRSTAAANYAHLPGGTDVSFKILVSDDQSSFDVIKRSYSGMFVGVVRQVKPLRGPKDFVFQVAVNYVKSGVVSYRNIVIIRFFISEFWF
ncbi:fibulin-1 [Gasterosteus aculeatus]